MLIFPLFVLLIQLFLVPPLSPSELQDLSEEHLPLDPEQEEDLSHLDQTLKDLLGIGPKTQEIEEPILNLKEPFASEYLAARQAESEGDVSQAAHYWQQLAEKYPDQPYVLNKAIPLMAIMSDIDKITTLLSISNDDELNKRLNEKWLVNNSQIMLTIFTVVINNKSFKEANVVLERFESRDIYTLIKVILQAWLLAQDQKVSEAMVLLDKFQKETIANHDFILIQKALLLHAMKADPTAVEKAYREALDKSKYPYYVLIEEYGRFLEEQGQVDKAKDHYQTYAEQFDPAWIQTIEARLDKKGAPNARVQKPKDGMGLVFDMAADYFAQDGIVIPTLLYSQLALRLDPVIDGALYRQGIVWASLKNYDKALHFLSLVPMTSHFYLDAQLKIAQVYEKKEDLEGAVHSLQEASRVLKDRIEALVMLGDILRRNDRFAESAKAYQEALKRIPKIEKEHWGILFSLAISQERSKNWTEAEKNLLKALELNPDQADVLNYLGYSWVDKNINTDKAFELLKKAAQLRPDEGAILDSLAWAYYRKGDYNQALNYLEKAIRLDPSDPVINDHLGDVYWRLGRQDEARFQWERVFVYKPDEDLAKAVKEKLAKGLEDNEQGSEKK